MITLCSNASANVFRMDNSPRLLVRICDASDALITSFDTSIKSSGVISRSIKPFGGLETVSELTLSDLKLGDDVRFCSESTLTPKDEGARRGAGRIISQAYSYAAARNASSGIWATPAVLAGQQYNGGSGVYGVYVGFFQAEIPAGLTVCDEATIFLKGLQNYSATDFEIYLLEGTWSALSDAGSMFNEYAGWQSSGAYSVTPLNETYDSSEYVTYNSTKDDNEAYNLIRLNAAGRAYIESCAGSVAKFAFISKRHADNTTPTGNEYINFDAPSAMMKVRYNANTLDNKRVYVYRYYEPFTGDYLSMQEVYRGVVDHWTLDNRLLTLTIKKSDPKTNIVIPKTVLSTEDYPNLPEDNIGKAVPIIYGDFMAEEFHKEGVAYVQNEDTAEQYAWRDYVRAYVYDRYLSKRGVIAGHAVKTLDNCAVLHLSSEDTFALLAAAVSTVSGAENKRVQLTNLSSTSTFPGKLTEGLIIPVMCYIPQFNANYITDPPVLYPVDTDVENYLAIEPGDSETYWMESTAQYQGRPYGSVYLDRIYFIYHTEKVGASPYDGNLTISLFAYAKDGGTYWDGSGSYATVVSDGWHFHEITNSGTNRIPAAGNLAWNVIVNALLTSDTVHLSNLCIAYAYRAEITNEFYIAVQGAYDDASGTVTGSASALIENPSHVIESISRSIIGLDGSEIDVGDFDSAATALTDWNAAFQLLDQVKVESIFDDIGQQCKSAIFRDVYDRLSIKTWLGDDFVFPHSGTDIPADLDIFAEQCSPVNTAGVETMTRNFIVRNSLTLDRVQSSEVKNSFILKYKKNYATGNYDGVLYIDNGEGTVGSVDTNLVAGDEANMESGQTITGLKTLCADSYTDNNNTTNQLVFEADYIRARATAVKLLQHLVEVYTPRRRIVEFTTHENGMWVEPGDVINVRHRRLYDELGLVTPDRKKWYPYNFRHNLSKGTITIKAIEV